MELLPRPYVRCACQVPPVLCWLSVDGCGLFWVWGDRLSTPSPSPAASSTTTAGTSEEEGLHARPRPRMFEVAFYIVSGDFGGGRIGTVTFLLTMMRSSLEGEGQALILTMYLGGGGTGPPLHNSGAYVPAAPCFARRMVRSGLFHLIDLCCLAILILYVMSVWYH